MEHEQFNTKENHGAKGNVERSQPSESAEKTRIGKAIDFEKASLLWRKRLRTPEDLFSTRIELLSPPLSTPNLMLGQTANNLKIVPYTDSDETSQAHLREILQPGEIAISIKHHGPCPEGELTERLKFECSHIQIAVGLKNGAMTINNPQNYQGGLFGPEEYPMIFIKPVLPAILSEAERREYIDNVRTWAVIANTFTHFPSDYNGGDPLTCFTEEQFREFGYKLIDALLGDEQARKWLAEPERALYCAELAYTSLNLGLHIPLNRSTFGEKVAAIESALGSRQFLEENQNPYIRQVELTLAPETLRPIIELVHPPAQHGLFWNGLAIVPFHSADLIAEYIQRAVPRKALGEEQGAKLQAMVLNTIAPSLEKGTTRSASTSGSPEAA